MTTTAPNYFDLARAAIAVNDAQGFAAALVGIDEIHPGSTGQVCHEFLASFPKELGGDLILALLAIADAADDQPTRVRVIELIRSVTYYIVVATSADAARAMLEVASRYGSWYPGKNLAAMAEKLDAAGVPLTDAMIAVMRRTTGFQGTELAAYLKTVTGAPLLNAGEQWADQARSDLATKDPGWRLLVLHAGSVTSAKPTAKWEKRAQEILAQIGTETAGSTLRSWLRLVGRPRSIPLAPGNWGPNPNDEFDSYNTTILRGLIWALGLLPPDAESARVLGAVVETSLRKVPGLGPRNPKTANSAVYALSRMDGDDALAQIARLAARVTYKGTLKELNAALDDRARKLGLSRDEVEELAVPVYGLTDIGRRVDTFDDVTVELVIGTGGSTTTWRTGAGKVVKAPPASVRADHAEALAEFKAAAKDIEKMLAAQVERLDRQFLAQRTWSYASWRERYLDHPLVGTLARRMIWVVDGAACGYADGALRDLDDAAREPALDATVELWHPIGRSIDEILAWRAWLERHGIVQPLKQAHREVYLLTAAEERTNVYSNRYAAHVLKQHQFHALAAARGWQNRLRLMVDDNYPPATRDLPGWGLRAEFWVEGIGDDYHDDITDSGSYLRISTDQVRFYPVGSAVNMAHAGGGGYGRRFADDAPVPLAEVPPLVLSEVFRDIDLFVGVASVGNDPTWQDGGPGGRFVDYWTSYSFGELTATAQTRRDLLARITPRLAIADRLQIEGRFLIVRGDIRSYKIHLGSGNILMAPNNQYLCIVPGQSAAVADTGGVFLPFEGDRVLAVILSKALLLAKDTAITDPTITRQIRM